MDHAQQYLCSVIIPAYNCQMYVKDTIQSVLNQNYDNLEIIIIDDCSTDKTLQIITDFAKANSQTQIYQNEKNLGVAETRNRGFKLSSGKYIALLDGDDIWEPGKLQKQIALLEKTGCEFCYTSYSYINSAGIEIGSMHEVPESCTFSDLLKENFICCSSVVLKKKLVENHNMSNNYFHEDFVFWLELLQNGYKVCGCTQSLVKYRISKHGRSYNKLCAAKNRWLIYHNYLKLSFFSSSYYFCAYTVNGLKKYYKLK